MAVAFATLFAGHVQAQTTVTSVATLTSPSRLDNNDSYFNQPYVEINSWLDGETQKGFFCPMHFNITAVKNALEAGSELVSAKLRLTHYRNNTYTDIGLKEIDGGWTEYASNRDQLKTLCTAAIENTELYSGRITFAKNMADNLKNSALADLADYQLTIDLTSYITSKTDADVIDLMIYRQNTSNSKCCVWSVNASAENMGEAEYKADGKWAELLAHFGFSSDAELTAAFGPALVFDLSDGGTIVVRAVQNETQLKGYDTLADALAEALAGDVLTLNEDQQIADRTTFPAVTIRGAEDKDITLTNKQGNKSAIVNVANNTTLTFEHLTIDAGGNRRSLIEGGNSASQKYVLKNVVIKNAGNAGNNEGIIHMKNGDVTLQDVTFQDCGNASCVRVNNNQAILKGTVTFTNCEGASLFIGGQNATIDATELSAPATPITIDLVDGLEDKDFILNTQVSYFSLLNASYSMAQNGDNVKIGDPTTTGIEGIENGKVEMEKCYDLSGRRTSGLQRGLNIVRTSDGVRKVVTK